VPSGKVVTCNRCHCLSNQLRIKGMDKGVPALPY
jgi:hypothetical protein